MAESDIIRTTIYLPRSLHTALKNKEINVSRMVRAFIDTILQDDELEIIEREIQQLQKRLHELEAKRQYLLEQRQQQQIKEESIMEKARPLTKYLNQLFKQHPFDMKTVIATSQIIPYIQEEYGLDIAGGDILNLQKRANSNGGELHIEDILPYFEKLSRAREVVIHA